MRIAYIAMGFPLGAETFACTDIRTLKDAGIDVTVYSMLAEPTGGQALLGQRGLRGLEVDYATGSSVARGVVYAVAHLPLALTTLGWLVAATWRQPAFLAISLGLLPRSFDIVRRLERQPPDVVHLFWGHYPSIVAHLVARRVPGCVVSAFLGAYDLVYRYGPSAVVAREADVVWTHARDNVPAIEALGVPAARIAVAHRGVDLDNFHPAGVKVVNRFVCAARLCHEKHVDYVLQAFAFIAARHPDASLVIMGEGPERPRLEDLTRTLAVHEAVRFTGHVPHAQVRAEMAAAEFFLLMSEEDTERLTNSLKEAMACGCLCLVTRSPGIEELITDGVHGFVLEHGDVSTAVAKVEWALTHEQEAAMIREAAVAQIRTSFDVRTAMNAYARKWTELAATRDIASSNVLSANSAAVSSGAKVVRQ